MFNRKIVTIEMTENGEPRGSFDLAEGDIFRIPIELGLSTDWPYQSEKKTVRQIIELKVTRNG